jgi:hypothetical protein
LQLVGPVFAAEVAVAGSLNMLMKLIQATDEDEEFPDQTSNYQLLNDTVPLLLLS